MIVQNYASGTRLTATPKLVQLLSILGDWRSPKSVAEALGRTDVEEISRGLAWFADRSILYRSDREVPLREQALGGWARWTPEATFFHFATKDVPFLPPRESEAVLREKAKLKPPPAPLKRVAGVARVPLPIVDGNDLVTESLLKRRTWRRFSRAPLDMSMLATLLRLTWGVQRWFVVPGQGKLALKTSPSPGARHNLEAYVLVRRIRGLRPGLYHYDPDEHALSRLAVA